MTISINWATRVISVPKADTALIQSVPTEIRELDLNTFRLVLKDLEDDVDGMTFPTTHNHNPPLAVGGVTLARVVELINDYTVTFEDGQYAVNLVGANSNVADRTNVNQVSVRSANSAGLVQVREIEHSSFNEGVTVDTVNGVAGTIYPTGTLRQPVSNLSDALLIASTRGLPNFYILSNISITSGDFSKRNFIAAVSNVTITLGAGAVLTDSKFANAILTGTTASSRVSVVGCRVEDLTYRGEYMDRCAMRGTLTLAGVGPVTLTQCIDDEPSLSVVTIDMSAFTGELALRDWFGGVKVQNKTAAGSVAMDIRGRVELTSSVTAGTFTIRGIGHLTDASVGTTVVTEDLLSNFSVADQAWSDSRALTVGKFIGLK